MFAIVTICGLTIGLILMSPRPRPLTDNEKYYKRSSTDKARLLPSIFDEPPKYTYSIIVPAYNEAQRMPNMLKETVKYLEDRKDSDKTFSYEIIVVDDASDDGTSNVALEFSKSRGIELKVLTLEKNRKKGGAVTLGILCASGKYILFADADGATKFSDLDCLEKELSKISKEGYGVAVGSRAHLMKTEAVVKRSLIRNFLMHSFHKLLYLLGIRAIKDTQCGFKLFTRKAALNIFNNIHVEGWIFDIEVLLVAQYFKMPIVEVSVTWHEIDGSKVSLIKDSIKMAIDLLIIRLNYLFGFWKVKDFNSLSKIKSE
ncbi:15788_t:CDS:2 [Funneliformis geosporum]|nr:15788_t:CDS:2 [Funneliformis geosporum]